MSSPVPPQPRGIDYNLPTCGETRCNSHGRCENSPDGGIELVCECDLGYQGSSCEDTVNGALSVPLTLSVLAVIIGLLILAFIVAKVRQKQKKRNRYWNISVVSLFHESFPMCCSWENGYFFSIKSEMRRRTLSLYVPMYRTGIRMQLS